MEHYDLVIVGAGPAGLSLARELASSNLKILLLDKKKDAGDVQYNTSGSFIDAEEWSLLDYVLNPIHTVCLHSKNQVCVNKVNACVIDRRKLLCFLENQAKENKNLKIEYGIIIKEIFFGERGIDCLVFLKNGIETKISATVFADCSGVGAVLGRKINLASANPVIAVGIEYLVPLKKKSDVAELFIGSHLKGGYGWLFPKDSNTAIVGYGSLSKECFSGIETMVKDMWRIDMVSEKCDLNPLEKHAAILRTGKPLHKFTEKNLLIIGDSALQANPFAGEGIRFVMDSSRIASNWIKKAIEKSNLRLLRNYDYDWKRKYYKKFKLAFFLQQKMKKYTEDDGKLDFAVRKLNKVSDKDFTRLLKGDFSYSFLLKLLIKLV